MEGAVGIDVLTRVSVAVVLFRLSSCRRLHRLAFTGPHKTPSQPALAHLLWSRCAAPAGSPPSG